MTELQINDVLSSILETQKQLAILAYRQQGWITALWETIQHDAELQSQLKQHPLYDQGPQSASQRTDVLLQNIDALLRLLKAPDSL
jgi:hypothetical protein